MFTGNGRIEGFHLYRESEIEPACKGLERLLELSRVRKLRTHIPVQENWTNIGDVAEQLIARDFPGKAVVHI